MLPSKLQLPQIGYNILTPFLNIQGRKIERVLGDGNCLFRALSLQITGDQEHHLTLRKIIAHTEAKVDLFKKFHLAINQTDYIDHQKNMSRSCTWGTNLEIVVTATIFQLDIYVASDTYRPGKVTWLKYCPDRAAILEVEKHPSIVDFINKFPIVMAKQWLEIAHVCKCHFDSIKADTIAPLKRPVLDGMITEEHLE